MGRAPPLTVNGEGAAKSIKHVNDDVAKPGVVDNATEPVGEIVVYVAPKKAQKVDAEPWNPQDFLKDAEFFNSVHGLPNEGIAPHKITDIPEEELGKIFGESSKNGYKLSNVIGIPTDHILALSQVVDGYEKPVNGILSHTFVKGVYADMTLKKKVNWAAYAASKLKGQVTQWARDKKPKPVGPPCIRKPQKYTRPAAQTPNSKKLVAIKSEKPVDHLSPLTVVRQVNPVTLEDLTGVLNHCQSLLPKAVHKTSVPTKNFQVSSGSNLLLSIIESEMSRMRSRLTNITHKSTAVKTFVDQLKRWEADYKSKEETMETEIARLRVEQTKLMTELRAEDDKIEQLTTNIELESNKQDGSDAVGDGEEDATEDGEEDAAEGGKEDFAEEVNKDLLKLMTDNLASHQTKATLLELQISSANVLLSTAIANLARKVVKRPDTPKTFSQFAKMSADLVIEQVEIESMLKAHEVEYSLLSSIFSASIPPVVIPCYTVTTTEAFCAEVDVSTCPIFCNGYHCFNWIPASCGHTFHPACLFAVISGCQGAPKCFACGEAFSHDWLRTWGIERGQGHEAEGDSTLRGLEEMRSEMANVYGMNSGQLALRRQWVKTLDQDFHLKAKCCRSVISLSSTVDTDTKEDNGEDGSSKSIL